MLERTSFDRYEDVILTAGAIRQRHDGSWRQVFGVFGAEEDARSMDADDLALAVISAEDLSEDQIALAERNTEALSDA